MNREELEKWFCKMGYTGEFPENWSSIYNNSTCFIWDQITSSVKPIQEINNVRHNIITNRFKKKPLSKHHEFPYQIEEIYLYNKKLNLEKKLKQIQASIHEKQRKNDTISQGNRIKYITIQRLNAKIKENGECQYLLKRKNKLLEYNISTFQEILSNVINLTPVELEENPDTKHITETLNECSKKLEELIQKIPLPNNNLSLTNDKSYYSTQKMSLTNTSTFERYLCRTEKKTRLATSIRKISNHSERNKENFNKKVPKCLFSEESPTRPLSELNRNLPVSNTENKRESLGLLPTSWYEDIDDVFLIDTKQTFLPDLIVQDTSLDMQNLATISETDFYSDTQINFSTFEKNKEQLTLQKVCKSEPLVQVLKSLLYRHNRQIISNIWQNIEEDQHSKIRNYISKNNLSDINSSSLSHQYNRSDTAKVHYAHLRTEFQILKQNAIAKRLSQQIKHKKEFIYSNLCAHGSPKLFEALLEDIGLDATLSAMKKEIQMVKKIERNCNLLIINKKLSEVKKDILTKIDSIKSYMNIIQDNFQSITRTSDITLSCARKILSFLGDMSWAEPLTENLHSLETTTFERFPLEYNRRCTNINPTIFFRDMSNNIFPYDIDIDPEDLYMLTKIIESPFSLPDTVFLGFLQMKKKLDALKSTKTKVKIPIVEKYSFEELLERETYIEHALNKLNSLLCATSSKETLSVLETIKKTVNIWLEMPFKDFVPSKRLVDGKNYMYYKKKIDSYYNSI